eukprot:1137243-Pelagomonas_calceolata.AAC.6
MKDTSPTVNAFLLAQPQCAHLMPSSFAFVSLAVVQSLPPLHPHAHPEGGQACPDGDLLKHQRELAWRVGQRCRCSMVPAYFACSRASQAVELMDSAGYSTPAPCPTRQLGIHTSHRSYLEKLADPWGVEPRLLKEAASTSDPARRMALIIAHFVAGRRFQQKNLVGLSYLTESMPALCRIRVAQLQCPLVSSSFMHVHLMKVKLHDLPLAVSIGNDCVGSASCCLFIDVKEAAHLASRLLS